MSPRAPRNRPPRIALGPELLDRLEDEARGTLERDLDLVKPLGHGGMGQVFVAWDRRLRRRVALKMIRSSRSHRGDARARFLTEAQIAAQLEHPAIVPFYGLYVDERGSLGLTMRLVDGETFADYLAACLDAEAKGRGRSGRYALARRMEHLARVCDAVQYAHDRAVVHRDIKPENIVLGAHHELYLLDWGTARVGGIEEAAPLPGDRDRDPDYQGDRSTSGRSSARPGERTATASGRGVSVSSDRITHGGRVLGTPGYMAPEQAQGDDDRVGPASDQYALGLIVQEAATLARARRPRAGEELLDAAARGDREPMTRSPRAMQAGRKRRHTHGLDAPAELCAIVERATATDPALRYPNVHALAEDLRRFVRNEPVSVLADDPWRRVTRATSRHPVRVVAAGLTILLAGVLVFAANVAGALQTEREAATRALSRTSMTATVVRQGDRIEQRLFAVQRSVASIAARAVQLADGAPEPRRAVQWLMPPHRAPPGGTPVGARSAAWAGGVELAPYAPDRPTYVLAPGAASAELAVLANKLAPLDARLPRRLAPDTGPRAGGPDAATPSSLRHLSVAFADGLWVTYPPIKRVPEGYDARESPWYRRGAEADEPTWGTPYETARDQTTLVPCYVAMRGRDGKVAGVVVAESAPADLGGLLAMPEVAGLQGAFVVDEGGQILVQRDAASAGSTPPDADEIRALLRAAQGRREATSFARGPHLWVFDPLGDSHLALLVRLDAGAYE